MGKGNKIYFNRQRHALQHLKYFQMVLYKEAAALKKEIEKIKQSGKTTGFVPTMGALHDGHISLVKLSAEKTNITICSIFVNPAQFNDPEDFKKYPVMIDNDILLLENAGCDILFFPAVAEIYPAGMKPAIHYHLGELEHILEGKYRPEHFQGVCQVMHRLIDIINPDYLFMGRKDYQQCLVVKRLLQLIENNTAIIIAGTLREETGLAMSSRNLRLSDEQKRKAAGIWKMLQYIKTNYTNISLIQIEKYVTGYLLTNGFNKVNYVAIADADTLQPVKDISEAKRLVALMAAFMGDVRLIDNIVLGE